MDMDKAEIKKRIKGATRTVTGQPANPIITNPTDKDIKEAFIVYGRFNPPTVGHERLVREALMRSISHFGELQEGKIGPNSSCAIFVLPTMTEGDARNPLPYDLKLELLEQAFGSDVVNIVPEQKNVFDFLKILYEEGYTDITIITGSDRQELVERVEHYNGTRPGSLYDFNMIVAVTMGDRTITEGINAVSASKVRDMIREGVEGWEELLPEKIRDRAEEIRENIAVADRRMIKVTTPDGKEVWKKAPPAQIKLEETRPEYLKKITKGGKETPPKEKVRRIQDES